MDYLCKCGTETLLKKDGSPWKHQTPDGEQCSANVGVEEKVEQPRVDSRSVFVLRLNVYRLTSLPLLEDAGWHNENKKLASAKAIAAGKNPTGEAVLVENDDDGVSSKIVLTYEVPVREG